ncbi:hypothetical protein HPB52_001574 [Rhipicephalus sanguineus]|uniref:CCHC-type domain-containing protein n=1 Tax=Rhipicephalus sanguineus TaxID=34632 RepID=A0A9D4PGK3_RHISA|nr:hypothetical protein HPB52_001574 [Rhipicephalus sanguineus]
MRPPRRGSRVKSFVHPVNGSLVTTLKEHFRIIVRPRGGMDVRRISQIKAAQLAPAETEGDIVCPNMVQNIFVVSTPTEKNAHAYTRVEALLVGSARYEVKSYLAAPNNTCKGIMWGVDLDFDHNQLRDMIIQPRNPKALEVKRIKDTPRSSSFSTDSKRQMDVCYACGRLGHHADVCPAPEKTICRGCGTASPAEDHECSPKCTPAEGLISQRTRPASNASKSSSVTGGGSGRPKKHLRRRGRPAAKDMIRTCQERPRGGAPPRQPAAAAGPVDALTPEGALARVSGSRRPPGLIESSRTLQSNPKISQLEQENVQLRTALDELRAQFESLRKSCSSVPPTPAPGELPAEAPAPARSAKERALAAPVEGERELEEFKSEITNSVMDLRESVNSLQGALMTLVETVTALTKRVDTLETWVGRRLQPRVLGSG